ncbi:MAG TPA: hypothetical protein VGD06_10420 [Acidobacteriota bacterium]
MSRAVAGIAGLLLLAVLPVAAALPSQETSAQRAFLGPDGQPLPFGSDDEILEFLRQAEVVSMRRIPVGVTRPHEVILERNGVRARAAYRDVDETYQRVQLTDGSFFMNLRDSCIYEAAAYNMAQLLGLDNVPPVVGRRHAGKNVTVQLWIENAMGEPERRESGARPRRQVEFRLQVQTMYLFDDLIGNVDRNEGNLLYDRESWKLWMIDHTRAFQRTADVRNLDKINWVREDLWERLRALERADVDDALNRLVGRYEIDSLFERRDKIVAHMEKRIDDGGVTLFPSSR